MKTRALVLRKPGGPEALVLEEIELTPPGPDEVQIRQEAIGINYIDVNQRAGIYPLPSLPEILGVEGAGVVAAVGSDVSHVKPGDRVAYASDLRGGYAASRNLPSKYVVPLPAGISAPIAASVMLKGYTAAALIRHVAPVHAGDTILLHAAAGGVGSLLAPWAKHLGAKVIGVVSTDEKAEVARRNGCDQVIVSSREHFPTRVKELTSGAGVRAVYDSVGKDTFEGSYESLGLRGSLVLFGQASGPVPPFEIQRLGKGSYTLTRPLVFHFMTNRDEIRAAADALFELITSGAIKVAPPRTYKLSDGASAHRDLQARQTTGSLVLIPD